MKQIDTKTGTIILLSVAYVATAIIAIYAIQTINIVSK
jgi:hypothetical protein